MLSKVEREVNNIRLKIYEATKDMTIQERVDRVNKIGETAAKNMVSSGSQARTTLIQKKHPEHLPVAYLELEWRKVTGALYGTFDHPVASRHPSAEGN